MGEARRRQSHRRATPDGRQHVRRHAESPGRDRQKWPGNLQHDAAESRHLPARKLRNGDVAYVTNNGMFTRMEGKTQKVITTFNVGQIPVLFGSIDVLPSGGVLIPDFQFNRVIEFGADGKQLKSFNVQLPKFRAAPA